MGDTSSMTASQSTAMMNASMAASAISPIVGTIQQVGAIKAQSSYAETIARTNAAMGKLKAFQAIEAGDVASARKASEVRQTVGSLKATQGGSGVDVNVGSPAATRSDIEKAGAIDVLTIKNNATRAAWGYETQSIEDTFQGQMTRLTGNVKAQQSIASGGLQAISGPLSIYGNYLRWSRYMGGGGGGGSGIVMPWSTSTPAPAANDASSGSMFPTTG